MSFGAATGREELMMTIRRPPMTMGRRSARAQGRRTMATQPPRAQGRRTMAMAMATQPPVRQRMSAQPTMMIGAASNAEPMKLDAAPPTWEAWQRLPVLALRQVLVTPGVEARPRMRPNVRGANRKRRRPEIHHRPPHRFDRLAQA